MSLYQEVGKRTNLHEIGNWTIYLYTDKNNPICYWIKRQFVYFGINWALICRDPLWLGRHQIMPSSATRATFSFEKVFYLYQDILHFRWNCFRFEESHGQFRLEISSVGYLLKTTARHASKIGTSILEHILPELLTLCPPLLLWIVILGIYSE